MNHIQQKNGLFKFKIGIIKERKQRRIQQKCMYLQERWIKPVNISLQRIQFNLIFLSQLTIQNSVDSGKIFYNCRNWIVSYQCKNYAQKENNYGTLSHSSCSLPHSREKWSFQFQIGIIKERR